MALYLNINELISTFDIKSISEKRKAVLKPLIDLVQQKVNSKEDLRFNFICTHNSRRSHLAQAWAQTLAHHFNLKNIYCYSGGTEATAVFPMVIETLRNSGFSISTISNGGNPIYAIKYGENEDPIIAFSKKFDDSFNPKSAFDAVMTCSQADEECPFVAGAEKRISITFEDPKEFDNTPQQVEKYNESNMQIASEMFYVFSKIKS